MAATMAPPVNAFAVREEREKRGKRRAPWGPIVAMPPLTSTGTGVALAGVDAVAVPRMATGHEEDDEVDRRGPGISGREGGEWESGRGRA